MCLLTYLTIRVLLLLKLFKELKRRERLTFRYLFAKGYRLRKNEETRRLTQTANI